MTTCDKNGLTCETSDNSDSQNLIHNIQYAWQHGLDQGFPLVIKGLVNGDLHYMQNS